MSSIPEPMMVFKSVEFEYFLKMKIGGFKLLLDYLEDPSFFLEDLSNIQVCLLKNPY
jgi:hypothetical protein